MGYTKHGGPIHENQMKGGLDDSLGQREKKKRRGKKGAHKAVRVQPSFLYHWLSVCQMPGGVSARKCFSDRPTCVLHIFRCV